MPNMLQDFRFYISTARRAEGIQIDQISSFQR